MTSFDRHRPLRVVGRCCVASCFVAGWSFAGQGPAVPWEYCSSPELAITDFEPKGVYDLSPLITTGCVPITDINLSVEITHPWVGDLLIQLNSSDSDGSNFHSTIVLDRPLYPTFPPGCDGDNIKNTFDDEGDFGAEANCFGNGAYFDDKHLIPNNSLENHGDANTCGYWELRVNDLSSGQTGVLHKWCVRVNHIFQNGFEDGFGYAWSQIAQED